MYSAVCLVASGPRLCAQEPCSAQIDITISISEGAFTDRGRRRRKAALGVLSALKFAAYKFQGEQLQSVLESPLVAAWQNSSEWTRQRAKEALPLPLVVLFRFGQALVNEAGA
eukprot:s1170_g8.t1